MKTIEEHANEFYYWLAQTAVMEGSASIIKQLPGKLEQIVSDGRKTDRPTNKIPDEPGLYWWRASETEGWVLLSATYNPKRIELEFKIVRPITPIQALPARWFEGKPEGQWLLCREPEVQG